MSTTSTSSVIYKREKLNEGGQEVAIITMNRPDHLNCFNTEMCETLARIFEELAEESFDRESSLVAIVFTGAGRAFCAGADLSDPPNPLVQSSSLMSNLKRNPVYQMSRCMVPIIGAVHGYCITGGFELALACDVLIGDHSTKFKDTHVKFGLAPCWGLSQKLQRLLGANRAKFISLTAKTIHWEDALGWGILNEVLVDNGTNVVERALEIAEEIAANNTLMVRRYKRAIEEGGGKALYDGLSRERELALGHYLEVTNDGNTFESAKSFIESDTRPRSRL